MMRGSFCQALPIGCMRVFMTPSCSSAVTFESRCSGTLNSESSWRRAISSNWLRVSTSSETIVISFSSVSTLTRIDWLATFESCFVVLVASLRSALRLRLGLGLRRGRFGLRLERRRISISVSRKARSSSSSETSPGRSGRSSVCSISVPLVVAFAGFGSSFGGRNRAFDRHALQLADQILVVAFGLGFVLLEPVEHFLEPVDGREDQRDGFAGDRHAVAEFAHQRFGGVRQRFQPRQPEEAAGALDGVDEAENIVEDLGVVRLLLEADELDVDRVEALVRLGQELAQQVVHRAKTFVARHGLSGRCLSGARSVCCQRA